MSLTKGWFARITHWDSMLWQICYEPKAILELIGFVTQKHLTPEQASSYKYSPMPVGTVRGTK